MMGKAAKIAVSQALPASITCAPSSSALINGSVPACPTIRMLSSILCSVNSS